MNDPVAAAAIPGDPTSNESASFRAASSQTVPKGARLWILAAAMIQIVFIIKATPMISANDRSRWCTVWSLIHLKTYQIDEIRKQPGWDTIDIIYDNGHFYSTKPPLLATLTAGVCTVVSRMTGWDLLKNTQPLTAWTLVIVNGVPWLISLFLFHKFLSRVCNSEWTHHFALATLSFGTLLTPFQSTLNNHTVAANGVIIAIFAIVHLLGPDSKNRAKWYFLAGSGAGWAAANELPALILVVALGLVLLRKDVRRTLAFYATGALIPIAMFVATNMIATGSIKPTYADYGSEKYRFVYEGVPSYWMDPQGIDQNLDTAPVYAMHCLIGHHGIWSLTPVWLFALAAWVAAWRYRKTLSGQLNIVSAGCTAAVLVFYLTRTGNYNYGGVSCALRWALWLIPLWLVSVVIWFEDLVHSKMQRRLAVLFLSTSVYSAFSPMGQPWQHPWIFRSLEAKGWINYQSPPPPRLERKLWTWFSEIPQWDEANPPWTEFTAFDTTGQQLTRRLALTGSQQGKLTLELKETSAAGTVTTRYLVDRQKFLAGAPLEETFEVQATGRDEIEQAYNRIRGLPSPRDYQPGVIRYEKTPLRVNAFRCQRIASQVAFAPSGSKTPEASLRYRTDAWMCSEIPFGVARVEHLVTEFGSDLPLSVERWKVSASSAFR